MSRSRVYLLNNDDFLWAVDNIWNSPLRRHFRYQPYHYLTSTSFNIRFINMDRNPQQEQLRGLYFHEAYVSEDILMKLSWGMYGDFKYRLFYHNGKDAVKIFQKK